MRTSLILVTLLVIFNSCNQKKTKVKLNTGVWQAQLTVQDNQILPFNFNLYKTKENSFYLDITNDEEIITVDEISFENDSIVIKVPVFGGYIAAKYTSNSIEGDFVIESMDRSVPFRAIYGKTDRFSGADLPKLNISGLWETEFSPNTEDSYMAKGIFTQTDGKVNGTFRTNTGDYRFLEGVMDKDSLKLSAFDGAHAFLFLAKATDSTLDGTFYSGNHFQEPFKAIRNEAFELSSPDSLTFIKDGYESLSFSFPDTAGNLVSLADEKFRNKVVILQIMGTWCPNCLDETKFLVEYLNANRTKNVEVLGLAFEYSKTEELAFRGIDRLVDRVGVPYPILLAQYGTSDKDKAQEKLPMLNHILSYPTTIFIDKKGKVRRIHTGFNGPATGDKYDDFKKDFTRFVNELLEE